MSQADCHPAPGVIPAYSAAQVREAEEPLLAVGKPLMAMAARAVELAVVRHLRERRGGVAGGRVVVLVGAGNNGGDGLFAAAGLARRGVNVDVLLCTDRAHDGGLSALAGTQARVTRLADGDEVTIRRQVAGSASHADVVVDAVAGIGISGGLRGPAGVTVAAARDAVAGSGSARPVVIAVDIPSGIGVDDGSLHGVVLPADHTVTMGAVKPGLLLPPASRIAGEVEVVDLGLDFRGSEPTVQRSTAADIAHHWPVPSPSDHKYSRGVLGIVAGSETYPGAAVLATSAAAPLVGMVRYGGTGEAARAVLARNPEVVVGVGQVQAWAVGSGIATDDALRLSEVRAIVDRSLGVVPLVVDAGGLAVLPDRLRPSVVLTPHAGELARLLTARGVRLTREQVEAEPVAALRHAVEVTGATVLLKGGTTLIAGPGTPIYSQADATPWLATAGAGDVLAGILGAVVAGRRDEVLADPALPARLAAVAAQVHGRASIAAAGCGPGGPITAMQVAERVPAVVREFLRE